MTTATEPRRASPPARSNPPARSPVTDAADRPAAELPADASFLAVGKQAFSEWSEDKVPKLSAGLAYFALISMAPLLVITLKVLSVMLGAKAAQGQLKDQITKMAGPQVAEALQAVIAKASSQPGAGTFMTIVAIVVALFGASGVFGELQDSLNTIFEVQPKPNLGIKGWIRTRFLSMTMVLGVGFLLLVSMFISAMITALSGKLIAAIVGSGGWVATTVGLSIDIVISTAVVTLLFAMMFKWLPDVKLAWRDVWLGAFVTAALFQIGKYLLGLYLGKAAPGSAYGAAGSLVAVLVWVYYSGFILYFGAEFTQVYARRGGRIIEPSDNAVKMSDEDRMERGVPHRERIAEAAASEGRPDAGRDARRSDRFSGRGSSPARSSGRLPSYVCEFDEPTTAHGSRKRWLFGAGGVVLGAIAGGVGTWMAEKGMLPGSTPHARIRKPNRQDLTTVNLEHRLDRIEQAAGDVERFEHKIRARKLADDVEALSHRIREAELRLRTPVPATFGGRMAEMFKEAKRHWSR